MMEADHTFRNSIVEKFLNFTKKQLDESNRTQDVVKNISVFAAQVYCLFKVKNLSSNINSEDFKAIFSDEG